jgi:hypothetical protein
MPPAKQPHGDFVSGTSEDRRTPALRYAEDYFKDSDEDEDGSSDDTPVVSGLGFWFCVISHRVWPCRCVNVS